MPSNLPRLFPMTLTSFTITKSSQYVDKLEIHPKQLKPIQMLNEIKQHPTYNFRSNIHKTSQKQHIQINESNNQPAISQQLQSTESATNTSAYLR
jgi:hypothetical protein